MGSILTIIGLIDYTFLFNQSNVNFKPSSVPRHQSWGSGMLFALVQYLIQFSIVIEMAAETIDKFFASISMALRTALFKTIYRGQRTNLTTQFPVEAARVTGEKSAAEGITY